MTRRRSRSFNAAADYEIGYKNGVTVGFRAGVIVERGRAQQERQRTVAAVAESPSVPHNKANWIDSIVGAFDNSPRYIEIIRNEQDARRRMDECVISFE